MAALQPDGSPAEALLQGPDQGLHPALIGAAHPGQVPGEVPLLQKAAEGLLLKAADGVGVGAEGGPVPLQQVPGQDHAGDADAGGQALGEGAEIHHGAVGPRHALEAGQGPHVEAELRVVVVLQDVPPRGPGGPGQELGPPPRGHGDGGGKVVAGGDVAQVGPALLQPGRRQPPLVDVHAPAGDPAVLQDGAAPGVAGVLNGRRAAPEELGHQPQQVLHPGPHHDLSRGADHPPVGPQVVRQGPAQVLVPLAVAVGEELRPGVEQLLLDAAPGAEGKQVRVHRPGGQVEGRGLPLPFSVLPGVLLRGRGGGPGRPSGVVQDVEAALGPGLQVALRHQHLVGGVHRVHRHRQLLGQGPLAGELLPPDQPPPADLLRQVLVELLVEGLPCPAVKAAGQIQHDDPPKLIP